MMSYLNSHENQVRPWSWDSPKRWVEIRKTTNGGVFTEAEIDLICAASDLAGNAAFAEYYPDIIYSQGYMNLEKDTRGYGFTGHFVEAPEHYLYKADGTVLYGANEAAYFNLASPGLREWWLDQAAAQMAGHENEGCYFFSDALAKVGVVAGGDYYDYWGTKVSGQGYWDEARILMAGVRDRFASKYILSGNFARPGTGDIRTDLTMDYLHMAYIESFEHFGNYVPHAHEAIALMQELAAAGKWMQITVNAYAKPIPMTEPTLAQKRAKAAAAMPDIWAIYTETERDELAEIYAYFPFKLAMFLMGAGERSYFKYTASKVVRTSGRDLFKNIMPFPEWNMPLGEPLELAQRNGNVYTRRFQNVEVVLNLDNGTCQFNGWTYGGGSSSEVRLVKGNATDYSMDGGNGGVNGQNVYLYSTSAGNVNQRWIEIDRGNGYYSYQKKGTNFCLDGGNGGARTQSVYLWTRRDSEQNQQWKKISVGNGRYRLEKRNAPGFSIDGGAGGGNTQNVYLYDSSNSNGNQQWLFSN